MSALDDRIAGLTLIDNHVHGFWLAAGDRTRFDNALNEASTEPLADFDSGFDTQLGFAVRAHCAPLLGLDRHADPDAYWRRRCEHTEIDLARRFLGRHSFWCTLPSLASPFLHVCVFVWGFC